MAVPRDQPVDDAAELLHAGQVENPAEPPPPTAGVTEGGDHRSLPRRRTTGFVDPLHGLPAGLGAETQGGEIEGLPGLDVGQPEPTLERPRRRRAEPALPVEHERRQPGGADRATVHR